VWCVVCARDAAATTVLCTPPQGAVKLGAGDPLCRVACTDGRSFTLRACVAGQLIEVNKRLRDQPALLQTAVRVCPLHGLLPSAGTR
jgi:glycine cleavage system H lipoate-binding protein